MYLFSVKHPHPCTTAAIPQPHNALTLHELPNHAEPQLEPSEWASTPPSVGTPPPSPSSTPSPSSAAPAAIDSVSAVILFRSACAWSPETCDKGGRSQRAPTPSVLVLASSMQENRLATSSQENSVPAESRQTSLCRKRPNSQNSIPTRKASQGSQGLSRQTILSTMQLWR